MGKETYFCPRISNVWGNTTALSHPHQKLATARELTCETGEGASLYENNSYNLALNRNTDYVQILPKKLKNYGRKV